MDKVTLAVLLLVDKLGHFPGLHLVLFVGVVTLLDQVHFLTRFLCLADCLVALGPVLERPGEDGISLLLHNDYSRSKCMVKMMMQITR